MTLQHTTEHKGTYNISVVLYFMGVGLGLKRLLRRVIIKKKKDCGMPLTMKCPPLPVLSKEFWFFLDSIASQFFNHLSHYCVSEFIFPSLPLGFWLIIRRLWL